MFFYEAPLRHTSTAATMDTRNRRRRRRRSRRWKKKHTEANHWWNSNHLRSVDFGTGEPLAGIRIEMYFWPLAFNENIIWNASWPGQISRSTTDTMGPFGIWSMLELFGGGHSYSTMREPGIYLRFRNCLLLLRFFGSSVRLDSFVFDWIGWFGWKCCAMRDEIVFTVFTL